MELNNLNLPLERRKALEQVLDQAWKDYQDDLTNLTDAAADEIETVLERDPLNARETVREYTAAANRLADDYYTTVRTAWAEYADVTMPDFDPGADLEPERVLWQVQGGFSNTDYNGLTYSQVMAGQARSGATIDDLWPSFSNIDDAQQFITDMTPHRSTPHRTTEHQTRPTKPKWARVPKGSRTCAFCAMLASRGYAYTSEEAAGGKGNTYHTDCHCQPMPNWGKQALTGYDEAAYKDEYERMKALADREYDGDILKAYRRSPGVCTDSVVPEALKKTPGRPPKFDADHPFRTFLGSRNLRDAVMGTNPMFGEGPEYQNNCQRCVVAYEMRRRGYAVTAMPRPMDPQNWTSCHRYGHKPMGKRVQGRLEVLRFRYGIGRRFWAFAGMGQGQPRVHRSGMARRDKTCVCRGESERRNTFHRPANRFDERIPVFRNRQPWHDPYNESRRRRTYRTGTEILQGGLDDIRRCHQSRP